MHDGAPAPCPEEAAQVALQRAELQPITSAKMLFSRQRIQQHACRLQELLLRMRTCAPSPGDRIRRVFQSLVCMRRPLGIVFEKARIA